MVNWNKTL